MKDNYMFLKNSSKFKILNGNIISNLFSKLHKEKSDFVSDNFSQYTLYFKKNTRYITFQRYKLLFPIPYFDF